MIFRSTVTFTTDGSGAATAYSKPISGDIAAIRCESAALNFGGSADYTFTRSEGGGTIAAISNTNAPWSTEGTAITVAACAEPVKIVVAQANPSTAGTVHIYYRQ